MKCFLSNTVYPLPSFISHFMQPHGYSFIISPIFTKPLFLLSSSSSSSSSSLYRHLLPASSTPMASSRTGYYTQLMFSSLQHVGFRHAVSHLISAKKHACIDAKCNVKDQSSKLNKKVHSKQLT